MISGAGRAALAYTNQKGLLHMSKKVIATGSVYTEDEAIKWLKEHGAKVVETELAVTLIELPANAKLERNNNNYWEWYIEFNDDPTESYVSVALHADAYDTELKLHLDMSAEEEEQEAQAQETAAI